MKQLLTGTRIRTIAELGVACLLMIWMQRSAERQRADARLAAANLQMLQQREQEVSSRLDQLISRTRMVWWAAAISGAFGLWMVRSRGLTLENIGRQLGLQIDRLGDREAELEAREAGLHQQESELAEQVRRLGERETELERQDKDLARLEAQLRQQEDALETQVLELAEQEDLLKQQVQAIEQREAGLSTRINQLEASDEATNTEHKQQLREAVEAVERLREEEASLKQEHSQQIRELRQQLTQAKRAQNQREAEFNERSEALDQANAKINQLTWRLDELDTRSRTPAISRHWSTTLVSDSFDKLILQARAAMPGLCISDTAGQRLSELNSAKERDNWMRETWRALGALHEYAVSEHEYAGDVWRWMKESGNKHAWHADRVAMHESPITMAMHGAARTFAIDTRVEASGKITMQAHLKIAAHGGQHVPRVFFHDDTTGETGLVHIGFIGPHHLVPVASSS